MKALAFGEILFDVFPDRKTLGGAPLNVAAHLRALGHDAEILSAVGADALGDEALAWLSRRGFPPGGVARLDDLPTGIATITLADGVADYEFNAPCAWDTIPLPAETERRIADAEWDAVIFGSLAQRGPASRESLAKLLDAARGRTVFFDVNIRKNFYSREILDFSLRRADILKLNDDEVGLVAETLGVDERFDPDSARAVDFLDRLCGEYGLRGALLTRGERGALARFGGESHESVPGKARVSDTVGAGDSFSAAFLAATAKGFPVPEALGFAGTLAEFVVSRPGATPDYDDALRARLAPIMGGDGV